MLNAFLRSLPYQVHTNHELRLMLAGKKPLAVFADGQDQFPEIVLLYLRHFDRHVQSRRLVRRDHVTPPSKHRPYAVHAIFFALPGEEWRIDEMIELRSNLHSDSGWSAAHERRQGELLGYEDWMNDYWASVRNP
jgi:hypothetical protein